MNIRENYKVAPSKGLKLVNGKAYATPMSNNISPENHFATCFLVSIDFHKLPSDVKVAFYCFIFTHRSMFFFVITICVCKNTGFYGVFCKPSLLVSMLQKHWYMFLSKKHHHFLLKNILLWYMLETHSICPKTSIRNKSK